MGGKPKVLVIDDENQILVLIKHALERTGFDVVTQADSTRAVETAARELPQIIVSDLMMPKLDGYGVLKAMRENPVTAAIPLVFLSAAPPTENLPKAFSHGVVGYFEKPFHPARLGQQLTKLLGDIAQRKNELHGSLRRTSLQFIVELMARERRTGILNVRSGDFDGRVVFKNGEAKDAALGSHRGEQAIAALDKLTEGEFTLSGLDGAQVDLVELGEDDFVDAEPEDDLPEIDGVEELVPDAKVLVVDDESDICKLLEKALINAGFNVTTAPNGKVALRSAIELRPEVVVCDIMMPEMDGWQLYHQLRADYRINEARFVFLSAYPDLEARLKEVGVTADGYVAKGTMLGALVRRVEALLKPRRELASLLEKKLRGVYQSRVEPLGIKHVLRLLHKVRFTGTLTLENVWHKLTCEFAHGQPSAVVDKGMVESAGPLAFLELCAQMSGELQISPEPPRAASNIDVAFDLLMHEAESDLTLAEQRVVDTNLVSATTVNINERALDFYLQLAPHRLVPVLEAVRLKKLPRDVIATVDLAPTEIEEVLRDLVRKRILSFDTIG